MNHTWNAVGVVWGQGVCVDWGPVGSAGHVRVVELGVSEEVVGEVGGAGCVDVEGGQVEAAAGGETGQQSGRRG